MGSPFYLNNRLAKVPAPTAVQISPAPLDPPGQNGPGRDYQYPVCQRFFRLCKMAGQSLNGRHCHRQYVPSNK